jgi:hypothetical protein
VAGAPPQISVSQVLAQQPQQSQQQGQPIVLVPQQNGESQGQVPIVIHLPPGIQPEQAAVLLQQPQLRQPEWHQSFGQKGAFAAGFEAKPIIEDPSLNQPKIQFIGAEQRQQQADNSQPQRQNLAVIRPQGEQDSSKPDQLKLLSVPPPPQRPDDQQELKDRIQQAALSQSQFNNAGRDREALLDRINVTGNHAAAEGFVGQLKRLNDFKETQPFASLELINGLINAELQLAVDNWIINEEIAGELAATFKIPRESASSVIVLTPADVDEMKFAGNNPTAAKTFHVKLQELLWTKIDQQYRITTDLLAMFSDALLNLLVGNGIVKDKFAEDIATLFYRANNRKIKLF